MVQNSSLPSDILLIKNHKNVRSSEKTPYLALAATLTVEYVGGVECLLLLTQDLEVEEGAVSHLVVIVHEAAFQQDQDTWQQLLTCSTKLCQSGHSRWGKGI